MGKLSFWVGLSMIILEVVGVWVILSLEFIKKLPLSYIILGSIIVLFNFTALYLMLKGGVD